MYEGIFRDMLLFWPNAIRGLGCRGLLLLGDRIHKKSQEARPLPEPGQRGYQLCHWLVGFSTSCRYSVDNYGRQITDRMDRSDLESRDRLYQGEPRLRSLLRRDVCRTLSRSSRPPL